MASTATAAAVDTHDVSSLRMSRSKKNSSSTATAVAMDIDTLRHETMIVIKEIYGDVLSPLWVSRVWEESLTKEDTMSTVDIPSIPDGLILNDHNASNLIAASNRFHTLMKEWLMHGDDHRAEGFYALLSENSLPHRNIVALFAHLMTAADEDGPTSSAVVDSEPLTLAQLAIIASKCYVALLRIPGSSVYHVFHPVFFQRVLSIVGRWPRKKAVMSEAGKSSKRKATDAQTQRPLKHRRRKDVNNSFDDEEEVEHDFSSMHVNVDHDEDDTIITGLSGGISFSALDVFIIRPLLVDLLRSVILLLRDGASLRYSSDILYRVIDLFIELMRLDPTGATAVDMKPLATDEAVMTDISPVSLACRGIGVLFGSHHGSMGETAAVAFKSLLPLLQMHNGGKVIPGTTIPASDVAISRRACTLIIHIASISEDVTVHDRLYALVQHLLVGVPDKADYRANTVINCVTFIAFLQPPQLAMIMTWFGRLSKNSKVSLRLLAVEIVSELFMKQNGSTFDLDSLLQILIGRLSDKAATVRAKALNCLTNTVAETSRPAHSAAFSRVIRNSSVPSSVLWSLLHKRALDDKPMVRKAAVQAIAAFHSSFNDVMSDKEVAIEARLLHERCMDPMTSVRKVALNAISALMDLRTTRNNSTGSELNSDLNQLWLDAVMPMVLDAETSVQSRCLELLEAVFITPIKQKTKFMSDRILDRTWTLLKALSSNDNNNNNNNNDEYQDLSKCLRRACILWSRNHGVLNASLVNALISYVSYNNGTVATEKDDAISLKAETAREGAWVLLCELAIVEPNKSLAEAVFKIWREHCDADSKTVEKNGTYTYFWSVLQCLGNLAIKLSPRNRESISEALKSSLLTFTGSPPAISITAATLVKVELNGNDKAVSQHAISEWAIKLISAAEKCLCAVVKEVHRLLSEKDCGVEAASAALLQRQNAICRYLFTIGEASQLSNATTSNRLAVVVQSLVASRLIRVDTSTLSQKQETTDIASAEIPASIRAHALVVLGKLCLRHEELSERVFPALVRELETSTDPTMRNNIVVVLCDLCVRYTALVDHYIPNIATCLRDSSLLVRRQTLTLLTRLLQEDYIKWKGALFFRFITSLVDDDPSMRRFADFCLNHLLLKRHPDMYFSHFIECIFHFNNFDSHPTYNCFPQSEREHSLFSLAGGTNGSSDSEAEDPKSRPARRMSLYRNMLRSMADEQRFGLTAKLVSEVLGSVVDGSLDVSTDTGFAVLGDTLSVLCCQEIQLSPENLRSHNSAVAADDGETDESAAVQSALAKAKHRLLSNILKKNTVENIVPNVIALKRLLEKQHSPLLRQLMEYLRHLMKDFRHEIKDIMAADKQLAQEIDFDLRKFENEEAERFRVFAESKEVSKEQCAASEPKSPDRSASVPTVTSTPSLAETLSSVSRKTPSAAAIVDVVAASPGFSVPRLRPSVSMNLPHSNGRKQSLGSIQGSSLRRRSMLEPHTPAMSTPFILNSSRQRDASTPAESYSPVAACPASKLGASPIPSSLNIHLYPESVAASANRVSCAIAEAGEPICLGSPDAPVHRPRRWNVCLSTDNKENVNRTLDTDLMMAVGEHQETTKEKETISVETINEHARIEPTGRKKSRKGKKTNKADEGIVNDPTSRRSTRSLTQSHKNSS